MFSAQALRQIAIQDQERIQNFTSKDQAALGPNTEIDRARYIIQKALYRGQNGYVYLAIHQATQKGVIIKELFPMVPIKIDNQVIHAKREPGQKNLHFEPMHLHTLSHFEQVKAKFLLEAETLKQVKGPHFVELLDTFDVNATAYIVLGQVNYPTLEALLHTQEPLTSDQLRGIFEGLLDAVEALHQQGIIHRDLKPSNIFVLPSQVVIGDFGTARPYQGGAPNKFTTMYTEAYCAPEQQMSDGDIGPWSDIYALGKILAELLQHLGGKAEATKAPESLNHLLNPTFQESLLATHYEQRFQSVKQIRQALNMLVKAQEQIDESYALMAFNQKRKLGRYRLALGSLLALCLVTLGLNQAINMGLIKQPLFFTGQDLFKSPQTQTQAQALGQSRGRLVPAAQETRETTTSEAQMTTLETALVENAALETTTPETTTPETTTAVTTAPSIQATPARAPSVASADGPADNLVSQATIDIQDTSLPLADLQKKESPSSISFNVASPYKVKVNGDMLVSWQEVIGSVSYQVSLTNIESWAVVFSNQKQDHTSINLAPYNLPAGHYRLYVQNLNSAGAALLSSYIDIDIEKTVAVLPAPLIKATEMNIAKGESALLNWTFEIAKDSTIALDKISYRVVIAQIKDAYNKGIIKEDISVNCTDTQLNLAPYLKESGTYSVKVYAQKADENLTSMADAISVYYTGENALRPLQFITPANTLFESSQPRKISWVALPEAKQYQLRVYFMATGLNYIDVADLTSATYDLTSANLPFGMYIAQIRYKTEAKDGSGGSEGTWSPFTDLHFSCGK